MTSDSVNLGSNPSPPATAKADVSGVSSANRNPELPEVQEHSRTVGRTEPGTGWVYFVTDGETIKIGFSSIPKKRVSSLQSGHPRKLVCLGVVSASVHDELALHQRFAHLRLTGEWFAYDPQILNFVEGLKQSGDLLTIPEQAAVGKTSAAECREHFQQRKAAREASERTARIRGLKNKRRELRKAARAFPGNIAVDALTDVLCSHLREIQESPLSVDRLRPYTEQAMVDLLHAMAA